MGRRGGCVGDRLGGEFEVAGDRPRHRVEKPAAEHGPQVCMKTGPIFPVSFPLISTETKVPCGSELIPAGRVKFTELIDHHGLNGFHPSSG